MASFEKTHAIVSVIEGGYQDDPDDAGNWYMGKLIGTNFGISAPLLAKYLGRTPTVSDMKNLSPETARSIYKSIFWDANNFGKLRNQSVATILYDGIVNHGISGMRILTEKALTRLKKPLIYYKVFTTEGIEHMNKLNQKDLFYSIKEVRANRYKASPKKKYIDGWIARLEKIKYYPDSGSSNKVLMYSALLIVGIGLLFVGI